MPEKGEIREGAREMFSTGNVNERLEEAVEERPLLKHLLDLRIVARALLIAAVLTLICLIFSAILAAFVLVISFFAAWILLGLRSYERRRPTRPAEDAEVKEGERVSAADSG